MRLTERAIRALRPRNKSYKVYDEGGLHLEVRPSGGMIWRYRYSFAGRERRLTLGEYPAVTLVMAREQAIDTRRKVVAGNDPMAEKRKVQREAQLADLCRFDAVMAEWFRLKTPTLSVRVQVDQWREIKRDILPTLGMLRVTDVTPVELLALVRKIEKARGQNIATRNLSYIRGALRYAVRCGMIPHNPASEMTGIVSRTRKGHRLALPAEQIGGFLHGLDSSQCHTYTKVALRLLVLTMVRAGEMCGAEWSEVDFEARLWRIPAERMKMNRDHLIPLSNQALRLFEVMRNLSGKSKFVFPSSSGKGHLMTCALSSAMIRLGWKDKATPHGFRALASTVMNENGFSSDAIERQLAHVEGNAVRAAYNRAEYLPERARMLQWWADFVDEKEQPSTVVPVNFKRAVNE